MIGEIKFHIMKTNGKENVPHLPTLETTFEDSCAAKDHVRIKKPKTQHSKQTKF